MFLTLCGLLLTGCADSAIHYKVESSDSVTKTTAVLWDENYFCDNQCSDEELEKIFNKDKYKDEEVEKATTDVITKTAPNNRLVGMRADGKLTKEATEKYITSYIEGDNEVIEFRYPIKDLLKDMEDEINTYLGTTEGSFKDAESLVEAYFDVSLESGLSPLDEIISTTIYESAKDVEKNKTSINKYKDEFTQKQQTAVNKYLEYFEITSTRGALEVYKKISKLDDIESEKVINMIDFMKKAKESDPKAFAAALRVEE